MFIGIITSKKGNLTPVFVDWVFISKEGNLTPFCG
jgi:hypothetical protein